MFYNACFATYPNKKNEVIVFLFHMINVQVSTYSNIIHMDHTKHEGELLLWMMMHRKNMFNL